MPEGLRDLVDKFGRGAGETGVVEGWARPAATPDVVPVGGRWIAGSYADGAGTRGYTSLTGRASPPVERGEAIMSQPKPVLPAQPRGRSLERLEDEIVKAETDRGRWVVRAESQKARGRDTRAALALLQITEGPPCPPELLARGAAGGRRRRRDRTRAE